MSAFKGVDLLGIDTAPKYYWLLTKAAFSKGWSIFSTTNLVLAFAAWGLARQYPAWQATLNDLIWQIPAGLGLLTIAIRWLIAPFETHKKTIKQADKRIVSSLDQVNGLQRQITASGIHAKSDRTKECVAKAREFFRAGFVLRQDFPKASATPPSPEMIKEWKDRVVKWRKDTTALLETCSPDAALRFNDILTHDFKAEMYFSAPNELQDPLDHLRRRLEILDDIINKGDQYFRA
jgi:hypothetical protein